jgi:hypothetical protein
MLHMLVVVLPMQAPSAASVTVHVRVVDHLSLPLPGFEASAHEVSECRSRTRVSEESVKRTVASEGETSFVLPRAKSYVIRAGGTGEGFEAAEAPSASRGPAVAD